jgi:hypothetical protein
MSCEIARVFGLAQPLDLYGNRHCERAPSTKFIPSHVEGLRAGSGERGNLTLTVSCERADTEVGPYVFLCRGGRLCPPFLRSVSLFETPSLSQQVF